MTENLPDQSRLHRGEIVPGKPLIVVAMASEASGIDQDSPVLLTGIGRINATLALTDCLHHYLRLGGLPSAIINIGTAGALRPGLSGLHRVDRVLLHDFSHSAVAALTGSDEYPPIDLSDTPAPSVTLATGDTFVEDADTRDRLAEDAHLVDMEGYAVARVAQSFGVPVQLLKLVSDAADSSAGNSWERELPRLSRELAAHTRKALEAPESSA
ncbi:MAG TPA: nucleosidase [Candidatus Corynebacterium avicola]|uniref:Nucleosidase n=1 Tax=Candidatus Corynebacterium avicola TaxID=2838527 RepID=A0A9D1RRD8_9CORY|nr:nucleosidase [Candidatus Corynebacterium avicola]